MMPVEFVGGVCVCVGGVCVCGGGGQGNAEKDESTRGGQAKRKEFKVNREIREWRCEMWWMLPHDHIGINRLPNEDLRRPVLNKK